MDKFKQLESFAAIAARGSLTAAATAEGVAPAIMGRRLDALEAHLGVKLFVRTTRRLTLTREGASFLEDCQRLLAELADAEASASAGGLKPRGHLRLTAPAGFGRRHVAPLVPLFRERHDEVTVSLDLSDRVVDLAAEGFDCAVRIGEMPDSSLVSVRLADNRRLCVATPAYLQRHGTPARPADLARHDCLTLSSDASQSRGWAFRTWALSDGKAGAPNGSGVVHVKPRGPLDCTDGEVLHRWCLEGRGIAWRSTWEVQADLVAGRLVELLAHHAAPPDGIHAVVPQRKHLPLRVRLWVEFLKERFAQPDAGLAVPH